MCDPDQDADLVEPEVPDWDETYAEQGAAMSLIDEATPPTGDND